MHLSRLRAALRRRTRRAGFTLPELLTAMVLLGIVGAGIFGVLRRQQAFYRSAREIGETRSQLRQALGALPADLRAVTAAGGDITAWSDSSIQFRSLIGSTVLCAPIGGVTITVPPTTLSRGNMLTVVMTMPSVGDSLLIFNEGEEIGNDDNSWTTHEITSIAPVPGGCPAATGLVDVADALSNSYELGLSAALAPYTRVGAPIRIYRQTRYAFYQGADGQWFLGVSWCKPNNTPQCSALEPVSGPYRPYAPPAAGTSGLTFTYFDVAGNELDPAVDPATSVASIGITVRGQSTTPVELTGQTPDHYRDSLNIVVGLRNRF